MKRAVVDEVDEYDVTSKAVVPKLVTFASGDRLPAGARFKSFRSREDGELLLTAQTERVDHVNRAPPQPLMLAVVNRATGRARLLPLEAFHLSPALEQDEADAAPAADQAARPTRADVGLTMGLARWKKMYHKSQRLSVASGAASVSAAVADVLEAVPAEAAAAPGAEAETASEVAPPEPGEEEEGLIPPQNRDATEPDGVFNRDDVVPPRLWAELASGEEVFRETMEELGRTKQSGYEYITKYLAVFEESGDEDNSILLTYMFYLLRLLRYVQSVKLKRTWKQLRIPGPILQHIRVNFMERSHEGWDRSARLVDKLVCYILVVALWMHNYTLDLNEMAAATRVQLRRIQMFCAAMGLTVSGERAVLKLPLRPRPPVAVSRRAARAAQL